MVVTFGFLAGAFYLTYRPRHLAGNTGSAPQAKIMVFNKIMLWAVTAVAVVFLFFPHVVTDLMASGDGDDFTPDMQRTVLHIEGMT